MRFARIPIHYNQHQPNLFERVTADELDLVHLDYHWPQISVADEDPWCGFATGFLKDLKAVHRRLYLEPQFRVVASAGGGDLLGCMEATAELLCEQGDEQLLLSGVRGANVLASLEELLLDHDLVDDANGQRIQDLTEPILAAQVELGGGPFAAALSEGARVVVSGCCDGAAPLSAAAVTEEGWDWDAVDALAAVALAAEVGAEETIELLSNSHVSILRVAKKKLSQRLEHLASTEQWRRPADLSYPLSGAQWQNDEFGNVTIASLSAAKPTTDWNLRLTCRTGYRVQAWLEILPDASEQILEESVQDIRTAEPELKVEKFLNEEGKVVSLWIAGEHRQREICDHWQAALAQHFETAKSWAASKGGSPKVHQLTKDLQFTIPRDAIAVAVDTRPAREWL